jgi:hypothetical protein
VAADLGDDLRVEVADKTAQVLFGAAGGFFEALLERLLVGRRHGWFSWTGLRPCFDGGREIVRRSMLRDGRCVEVVNPICPEKMRNATG